MNWPYHPTVGNPCGAQSRHAPYKLFIWEAHGAEAGHAKNACCADEHRKVRANTIVLMTGYAVVLMPHVTHHHLGRSSMIPQEDTFTVTIRVLTEHNGILNSCAH